MSKFTKALEKVQEERQSAKPLAGAGVTVPPLEQVQAAEAPYLDRGIASMKNILADDRMVMVRFPESMAAEQYRMMRTSLRNEFSKIDAKVILISSSIHSEGKSITASNLAVSLAETGDYKVALIDADLRRGKIGEYLGFGNNRLGLTEFLSDTLNPKQVMVRGALKNLVVIPRGAPSKKAAELISSNKLAILIAELRQHFDYVIVDSPPIMSVADAGIMSKMADGVVFIIQVGRTPKTVIAHAQQLFHQAGAKMFGCVLTNVEFQSADYRYYNYYSHYYGDGEMKDGLKQRSQFEIKKAGWSFHQLEEKFNAWWERKFIKKK